MPHVVIDEALDLGAACQALRFGKTNLDEFLR